MIAGLVQRGLQRILRGRGRYERDGFLSILVERREVQVFMHVEKKTQVDIKQE